MTAIRIYITNRHRVHVVRYRCSSEYDTCCLSITERNHSSPCRINKEMQYLLLRTREIDFITQDLIQRYDQQDDLLLLLTNKATESTLGSLGLSYDRYYIYLAILIIYTPKHSHRTANQTWYPRFWNKKTRWRKESPFSLTGFLCRPSYRVLVFGI